MAHIPEMGQLSFQPKLSLHAHSVGSLCKHSSFPWIFYCGAIDTMTHDPTDLISTTHTPRTKIQTANEESIDVTRAELLILLLP